MAAPHFSHFHLISDSTGETLSAYLRALAARFAHIRPIEHVYALVRSPDDLALVLDRIKQTPGIVMFTIVDEATRRMLEDFAKTHDIPCMAVLDPALAFLDACLGKQAQTQAVGRQHVMNRAYFDRIAALDYTIQHDDGQNLEGLAEAEVILTGPSRTSKTPTCIYLAHRGIKAANVPLVPSLPPPEIFDRLSGPLIIGLVAEPTRLSEMRRQRFRADVGAGAYIQAAEIAEEINRARHFFAAHNWPVIDVTRHSVEETVAAVLNLRREREEGPRERGGEKTGKRQEKN